MGQKCGSTNTTTGRPCQHDKGSCPFPAHREPAGSVDGAGLKTGRPSKFNADRAMAAIHAAEIGTSVEGCGRAAGVAGQTIHDWSDNPELEFDHPKTGETINFSERFGRARYIGEQSLLEGGIDENSGEDSQFIRFLLATSYGYQKTEGVEVTGGGGGPLEINIREEVIKTGYDDKD